MHKLIQDVKKKTANVQKGLKKLAKADKKQDKLVDKAKSCHKKG